MKQTIIYLILLILSVSFVSAGNVSLNYVFDGSEWIPWLATAEGKPKIDLNLMNITAGKLIVDSYTFYVDDTSDFVGLRTESPSATLDVSGNISVPGMFFVDNESQRVGINTTSPTATLHVIGDANISGRLDVGILNISGVTFAGGNIDTSNVSANYFLGDGSLMSGLPNSSLNYVYDGSDWIGMKSDSTGVLQMDISNDIADDLTCTDCIGAAEIADVYVLNTGDDINGNLTVRGNLTVDTDTLFVDNESDRVAIGATSPNVTFHVSGSANITGTLSVGSFEMSNAGAGTMNVSGDTLLAYNSGNVGIGTKNPGKKLEVAGTINATGLNITGTEENATFMGDVMVLGTLYGGSPLKISGGINITDGNITTSGRIIGDHKKELVAGMNMTLLMHFNNDSSVGEDLNTSNGSIIYDYSNRESNGTLYGNDAGVTYLPSGGMFGGAYEFDGKDAYVHVTGVCQTDIILWDEGTVSLWFKGNAFSYLDDDYLFSMSDNEFTLSFSTGNDLKFMVYDGSVYESVNSTTTNFQKDKWYHVAVTYGTTGGMELYLNGVYEASNSFTDTPRPDCTADHDRLVIGNAHTPDFGYKGFNGTIDEFAMWNRSLSADEISNVYKKGFANVVEGSTVFDEETRIDDNLVVRGNLSGEGDLIINPNGGDVEIGTTSSNSKLVVVGGINASGGLNVTAGDVLLATSSGNVGIGTESPFSGWNNPGSPGIEIYGTDAHLGFEDSAGGSRFLWGVSTSLFGVYDDTAEAWRLVIDNNGNVGIGDPTPTEAKLDIDNPDTAGNFMGAYISNDDTDTWTLYLDGSSSLGLALEGSTDDECYEHAAGAACSLNDYAEMMEFSELPEDGELIIINTENPGLLKVSTKPYDKLVAGIASEEPAMVIGSYGITIKGWNKNSTAKTSSDGTEYYTYPLAISGRKKINVNDENGEIMPGDLLVTSSERGKAMRCEIKKINEKDNFETMKQKTIHNELCRNTAVAKAMTSKGEDNKVLALITLQ